MYQKDLLAGHSLFIVREKCVRDVRTPFVQPMQIEYITVTILFYLNHTIYENLRFYSPVYYVEAQDINIGQAQFKPNWSLEIMKLETNRLLNLLW